MKPVPVCARAPLKANARTRDVRHLCQHDGCADTGHGTREHFAIVLRDEGSDRPAEIRLRQLLKLAGRGFRLRCISCEPIEQEENAEKGVSAVDKKT
jgi:hypothetical protein